MSGVAIALLVYFVVAALIVVSMIGKHRKPVTPGDAVFTLAVYALLAWAVISIDGAS